MVLVSATPYFPAQARAAVAQLSVDAFSDADWAAQRQRHTRGDDQIRLLFDQMRGLKDSYERHGVHAPLLATIAARTLIVHGAPTRWIGRRRTDVNRARFARRSAHALAPLKNGAPIVVRRIDLSIPS